MKNSKDMNKGHVHRLYFVPPPPPPPETADQSDRSDRNNKSLRGCLERGPERDCDVDDGDSNGGWLPGAS